MQWTVDQALAHWRKEDLITDKKEDELRASLSDADGILPNRAIAIFSAIGAVLIGLGVILFVGSNWAELTPTFKTALLCIAMLGTGGVGYWFAYEKETYPKAGLALLFVNILIFGASIFLVAQIYHLPLNFWLGMLLWFLGAVYFAYTLQSRMHAWLAVPLLIFFLGWLRSRYVVGFSEFEFLFNQQVNILGLLPVIGVGLMSLGLLHGKRSLLTFANDIYFHWGLFLLLLPLIITTVNQWFFVQTMTYPVDAMSITLAVLSLVAVAAAVWRGTFRTKQGKFALIALVVYVAFMHAMAWLPVWTGDLSNYFEYQEAPFLIDALHVVHILLVFVLLLTIVWEGTLLRKSGMINMGIAGLGIAIIVQYFSWVFALLDRSIAFILGGILILALSALLERKRRTLLSSFASRTPRS